LDLRLALNRLIYLNNAASFADVPKLRSLRLHAKIARSVKPGSDADTSNTRQRKKWPGEKRRRAAG
jgi:hypothetical protein